MNGFVCIMSSMKCLSTVVRYVMNFFRRDDVLISYIEMHVNFDVKLKYMLQAAACQKIEVTPLNVVCKSASNIN